MVFEIDSGCQNLVHTSVSIVVVRYRVVHMTDMIRKTSYIVLVQESPLNGIRTKTLVSLSYQSPDARNHVMVFNDAVFWLSLIWMCACTGPAKYRC
jgi:hypothetical protein